MFKMPPLYLWLLLQHASIQSVFCITGWLLVCALIQAPLV